MTGKIIFTAALLAAALPALAGERREAGAHSHGHGRLDVAIEGGHVSMALAVPGADILGFEHEAKTKEQKAKVAAARKTLADPLALFVLPAEAGCKLAEAKVEIEAEGHAGHAHGSAGEGHSEVHAEYALTCANPERIGGIGFRYFELFPGAEELDVTVATEKGQTAYEVTRDKPAIKFGEVG